MGFKRITDIFKDYIGYNPETKEIPIDHIIMFSIEMALILVFMIIAISILLKLTKDKKKFFEKTLIVIVYLAMILVAYIVELKIFTKVLIFGLMIMCAVLVVNYAPEIKNLNKKKSVKIEKKYIENEQKDELIETLVDTVKYLTDRRIGAIITIERDDSLDSIINNGATKLESLVSLELLATIFFPNTALHDGGVIIRGNLIMCASAFYPPSEKADIEKHYGSRHRAALGISERTDAFTIVCSEETGKVSYTLRGTIKTLESIDELRDLLKVNIIVSTERNKHE